MENNYVKQANKISVISLIVNAVLSAFKFFAGVIAGSSAMISDAVHSMSDFFSTIVVMIGIQLSGKKADKEHPYGHERMECLAALVLSAMLFATAIMVGYGAVTGIIGIINGEETEKSEFLFLALVAAVLSIVVKFALYLYTDIKAKKLKSTALHGDALHHLSDSLSSIGSVIGIVGSMSGVAILDPIASLVICLMIIKSAYDICAMAVNQMIDVSADDETIEKLTKTVIGVDGLQRIDVMRTRMYGSRLFVEAEIAVDSELSLIKAHMIAERVHEAIEEEFPEVKHCMVHVNPITSGGIEPDNHELPSDEW